MLILIFVSGLDIPIAYRKVKGVALYVHCITFVVCTFLHTISFLFPSLIFAHNFLFPSWCQMACQIWLASNK